LTRYINETQWIELQILTLMKTQHIRISTVDSVVTIYVWKGSPKCELNDKF